MYNISSLRIFFFFHDLFSEKEEDTIIRWRKIDDIDSNLDTCANNTQTRTPPPLKLAIQYILSFCSKFLFYFDFLLMRRREFGNSSPNGTSETHLWLKLDTLCQ